MNEFRILFHRVISPFGDFPCSAGAPELNVADYFLWQHLKESAYKKNPNAIEDLRHGRSGPI
jgi:hypothetical protein